LSLLLGRLSGAGMGVVNPMTPSARFSVDQGVPHLETSEQVTACREASTEIALINSMFRHVGTGPVRSSVSSVSERKRPGANGPAVWQLALGLTAAVAVGWLLAAAARFARRRGYRRGAPVRRRTGQRVAGALARVTALLDLGMIALIAVLPGLVDSGFIGWLDIPLGQRLVWRLPLAVAVLMLAPLGIGTIGWIQGWWARSVKWQYAGPSSSQLPFSRLS
jgi:hypothetical protein